MIGIKMELAEPKSAVFTLTMTMTLKEWLELSENLEQGFVASNLGHAIDEMVRQASQAFAPQEVKGL